MMPGEYPTSTPELEDRIEQHQSKLFDIIDNLPPTERDDIRDPAGWSAKDHIAHLTMWERSMHYLLTGRDRHDGLGVSRETYLSHDVDRINDEIYRQHRDRTWDSIRTEFDAVHQGLLETLREHGWDELQNSYSYFAPDEPGEDRGDPIIYYVAGNTFFHYDLHREWIEELLTRRNTSR